MKLRFSRRLNRHKKLVRKHQRVPVPKLNRLGKTKDSKLF